MTGAGFNTIVERALLVTAALTPLVVASCGEHWARPELCGEAVVEYDFEGDDGGFSGKSIPADGYANPWIWGNPEHLECASGSNECWTTGLETGYGDCQAGRLESPIIDLSPYEGGDNEVLLLFEHAYWFEPSSGCTADGGYVQLRSAAGTWEAAKPVPGYNGTIDCPSPCGDEVPGFGQDAWGHYSNGWSETRIALGDRMLWREFQFRFTFVSDGFNTDDGWLIDDMEIRVSHSGCEPP